MAYQLNTSGTVLMHPQPTDRHATNCIAFSGLDPFTRGYVEAMLGATDLANDQTGFHHSRMAFRDLAPETLARIMKDCERFARCLPDDFQYHAPDWERRLGHQLWDDQKGGLGFRLGEWSAVHKSELDAICDGFPPLTPYPGDDGKVYLREA